MPGFEPPFDPNQCDLEPESSSSFLQTILLVTGLAFLLLALLRFLESRNRFNYESRTARIIAGLITVTSRVAHSNSPDLDVPTEKALLAVGPHRTSLDAFVVASKLRGPTPPQYLATDAFNALPGIGPKIGSFLKMFKAISVPANGVKGDGRSAAASSLELGSKALDEKGCVVLFPQGNFSKIGQDPHKVYPGAAKLAIANGIPIHVIRLDNFWCLKNSLIPLSVRNSQAYRAFFSLLHMNNVQAKLCCVIDFHLNPENAHLKEEEIIDEICAQLYAYFRHTRDLTPKQVDSIKVEIGEKRHHLIWKNKVEQDATGKQLIELKKAGAKLEEPTTEAMRFS